MWYVFLNLRAGGEDSAFSNSSIILQLREQVSQLQVILQEKEESEKTAAQKLGMYQNQLHAKNNEVATLKDQLQAQVCVGTHYRTRHKRGVLFTYITSYVIWLLFLFLRLSLCFVFANFVRIFTHSKLNVKIPVYLFIQKNITSVTCFL